MKTRKVRIEMIDDKNDTDELPPLMFWILGRQLSFEEESKENITDSEKSLTEEIFINNIAK